MGLGAEAFSPSFLLKCRVKWIIILILRLFWEEYIMNYKIALIPGDGIGPEIVREAKTVREKGGQVDG